MSRKWHSPEQLINKLLEAEALVVVRPDDRPGRPNVGGRSQHHCRWVLDAPTNLFLTRAVAHSPAGSSFHTSNTSTTRFKFQHAPPASDKALQYKHDAPASEPASEQNNRRTTVRTTLAYAACWYSKRAGIECALVMETAFTPQLQPLHSREEEPSPVILPILSYPPGINHGGSSAVPARGFTSIDPLTTVRPIRQRRLEQSIGTWRLYQVPRWRGIRTAGQRGGHHASKQRQGD
ncbi:MAG: hypothetical protein KatS3mg111_1537 [Pirellulaceae bacterium]|nr:MAG: hypothetical protein KatS3mg111_1537 [Pirellulaceae bacterium]